MPGTDPSVGEEGRALIARKLVGKYDRRAHSLALTMVRTLTDRGDFAGACEWVLIALKIRALLDRN